MLTRDIAAGPGRDALAAAKPEAELLAPKPVSPAASVVETGKAKPAEETITPPARSPYRGLLSDLFPAIGEKWVDRGTMYLPLPSGGDVILQLSDFPVVRFSGGAEALIDFRGGIPPRVADAISAQWKSLRVVSLADAGGAGDRIDRILRVSGYHSVKEGVSRPVEVGETVSVALPARWIIQRTEDSLLSGDLILLKEVPEKPDPGLLAVLRYARRVGIRVLPYADDPNAMEGFLVGFQEETSAGGMPVALVVPKAGGLPAVDFGLSLLGIASKTGERLSVGGEGDGFRLVVSPERLFEVGGKRYVVDTGKISPANPLDPPGVGIRRLSGGKGFFRQGDSPTTDESGGGRAGRAGGVPAHGGCEGGIRDPGYGCVPFHARPLGRGGTKDRARSQEHALGYPGPARRLGCGNRRVVVV